MVKLKFYKKDGGAFNKNFKSRATAKKAIKAYTSAGGIVWDLSKRGKTYYPR